MDSLNSFLLGKRKEEYQIQHFEFSASQYAHEAKEELMSVIEEAANAFERSLIDKYQTVDREEVNMATRKLIEAYSTAVEDWDPSFTEKLDDLFLNIPSNVLLHEDKPQEVQYSRDEVEEVDREIRDMEKKIIGLKYMKMKLTESLKEARKAQECRSRCVDSAWAGPSSSDLVKAVDEVIRKRRKVQEMDCCLLEGLPKQEMSDSTLALKTVYDAKLMQVSGIRVNIRNKSPAL
ncbi:protein MIS12 homolog isoform X2 [Hetaerina americana]